MCFYNVVGHKQTCLSRKNAFQMKKMQKTGNPVLFYRTSGFPVLYVKALNFKLKFDQIAPKESVCKI
jgi:hypothetical protein